MEPFCCAEIADDPGEVDFGKPRSLLNVAEVIKTIPDCGGSVSNYNLFYGEITILTSLKDRRERSDPNTRTNEQQSLKL